MNDYLDSLFTQWRPQRKVEAGDPPPAEPPHEGWTWNPYWEVWEESDAEFRARIEEAMK